MAAERLTSFKDGRSVEPFIEILKGEQTPFWLRRIAVSHMASFSDLERFYRSKSYMEALKSAADDADRKTAELAQETLEKMQIELGINLSSTYSQSERDKN
jgi:hypothetical protein